MGFKGLVLASVMVLTVLAGCEQNVTKACSDRQEVCTSFCDFSVECMDIFDPECVTKCLAMMDGYPISWLETCVDNAKLLTDKDERCQIAYYETELAACFADEMPRSSWQCTDATTMLVCAEDGCCVAWDCVEWCGEGATLARCILDDDGYGACECAT